ncbi:MAG: HAD family hydrolase [Desulfovibrionaceae bacterium]
MTAATHDAPHPIEVVFFDFNGVLAEDGFGRGLAAVADRHGLDPHMVVREAVALFYADHGYLTGKNTEANYWRALRERTGIADTDTALKAAIAPFCRVRPRMLELADTVRAQGMRAAILSDHTTWLDELDAEQDFFRHFDRVFNSWHEGFHKQEPACFRNALAKMAVAPGAALFIDDMPANVALARSLGMHAIHYVDHAAFETAFARYLPPAPRLP